MVDLGIDQPHAAPKKRKQPAALSMLSIAAGLSWLVPVLVTLSLTATSDLSRGLCAGVGVALAFSMPFTAIAGALEFIVKTMDERRTP